MICFWLLLDERLESPFDELLLSDPLDDELPELDDDPLLFESEDSLLYGLLALESI